MPPKTTKPTDPTSAAKPAKTPRATKPKTTKIAGEAEVAKAPQAPKPPAKPAPLKMGLITDIHFGTDKQYEGQDRKLSSRALSLVRYLVNRMNGDIRPDFVVQLGDLIEDEDAETDEENYRTAIDAFKPLKMPMYHAVGNHEQVNLGLEKIHSMLNYPKLYYSFDAQAFHFVVLFSTSKAHTDIHVDAAQRKWLAEDLEATDKPTVVFIHHPIDDQDLTGSFWFEKYPKHCFVEEKVEIRETLARSGKVRAVFSGHVHRNNLQTHDGIHYITVQSLVENMSDSRKVPSESYAIVTFGDDEIRVEIAGQDPAEYRF